MNKIKVIIKRPDEAIGHVTWISDTLENLQRTVGGYIETVTLEPDYCVICNEEGRIQGLEHNCYFCGIGFVGTILVVGTDGDEFCDVPISVAMANTEVEE